MRQVRQLPLVVVVAAAAAHWKVWRKGRRLHSRLLPHLPPPREPRVKQQVIQQLSPLLVIQQQQQQHLREVRLRWRVLPQLLLLLLGRAATLVRRCVVPRPLPGLTWLSWKRFHRSCELRY
jgi:hypothetical protein